jgi:hypothetical protein
MLANHALPSRPRTGRSKTGLVQALKQFMHFKIKINTKKLSSLQRKLMTKNDTSKTANMKWDGSV